jgi:RNA-directed DNA polymerase
MRDRAMQALYLLALDPVAETIGEVNSYGFRQKRSTADAIEQCFTVLAQRQSAQWILEGDIKACFDAISHQWLLTHIPIQPAILRQWLKAGFIDRQVLYSTEVGTPQGGICSPVLMNMTLDGLEHLLEERFASNRRLDRQNKLHLVRYADDFIITGSSKELLEREVKPLVEEFLRERGLILSPTKTKLTHIENGFDFLGQNVRKRNGKLIIKPSEKNRAGFLKKVRGIIKGNPQATAGNLIGQLNPVIRGWANYHRHVVSRQAFQEVDHAINASLWRWAKRRHPRKSRQWVKEKYFRTLGGNNWVFNGEVDGKNGQPQPLHLWRASEVKIQRHRKIKGEANPYDPDWEIYFEERESLQMADNLKRRQRLLHLWQEQGGICPMCEGSITRQTGWHNHHIIWRSLGGEDRAENRVLLHPNCHRQVHSQRLEVVKPRLRGGV